MFSMWPGIFSLPYTTEASDIVNSSISVAVNILGPRNDAEARLYTDKTGQGPVKDRFKAHKMLFVYGAHEGGGQDDVIGFGIRWIIGIGSFMLGNLSAPLTGQDLSMRRFAVTEIQTIDEEMQQLMSYSQYRRRTDAAKGFTEMLLHKRHIFVIIKHNAEAALFLRIVLIVTSSLAFTGALINMPNMLMIGTVGMFGSACAMLLKTGFDSTAFQIRQEAAVMRRFADYVSNVHWSTGSSSLPYPS